MAIRKTGSGAKAFRYSVLAKNKLRQLKRNGNVTNSRKTIIAQGITATAVNGTTPYIFLKAGNYPEYLFIGTATYTSPYYKYKVKLNAEKLVYSEKDTGEVISPVISKVGEETVDSPGQIIPYLKGYISLPRTRYKSYLSRLGGADIAGIVYAWSHAFVVPTDKAAIPFPDGISPTAVHTKESLITCATIDSKIVLWVAGAEEYRSFPMPNVPVDAQFEWRFNLAGDAIVGGEIRDSLRRHTAGERGTGVHEYRYLKFYFDTDLDDMVFTHHTVYTDSTVKIVGVDFSYSSEYDAYGMVDDIVVAGTRNYGRDAINSDIPNYTGSSPSDPAPSLADIYSELIIRRDGVDFASKPLLRNDGGIWNGFNSQISPYWTASYIAMVRGLDLRFSLASIAARSYNPATGDAGQSTYIWNFSNSPNVHPAYSATEPLFIPPDTTILSPLLDEDSNSFEWYTMMFYAEPAALSVNPDINTGEYTAFVDTFYGFSAYVLDIITGIDVGFTTHKSIYNRMAVNSSVHPVWSGPQDLGIGPVFDAADAIAMHTGYSKIDGYTTHDLYVL